MHGMWSWDPTEPNFIKTTRVRKREVITIKFDFDALLDFHKRVSQIHFRVKFPGGWNSWLSPELPKECLFLREVLSFSLVKVMVQMMTDGISNNAINCSK